MEGKRRLYAFRPDGSQRGWCLLGAADEAAETDAWIVALVRDGATVRLGMAGEAAGPERTDCISGGALAIATERHRQVTLEGWTTGHDDEHADNVLAAGAACYALSAARPPAPKVKIEIEHAIREVWPFGTDWWKPTNPRADLVRAGALCAAAIDRIDRAAAAEAEGRADG